MMIDAPGYEDIDDKNREIELTEDNAEDVLRYLNTML